MKQPTDAFAWLITEFRRYTRNEITWRRVQEVLAEAEALRGQYDNQNVDDLLSFSRQVKDLRLPESAD